MLDPHWLLELRLLPLGVRRAYRRLVEEDQSAKLVLGEDLIDCVQKVTPRLRALGTVSEVQARSVPAVAQAAESWYIRPGL